MDTWLIGLGLVATLTAVDARAAAPQVGAAWTPLMQASGPLASGRQIVEAAILEAAMPLADAAEAVGNTQVPRNDRSRRLRLRVRDASTGSGSSVHEADFPSVTVPGDPCSVRTPEALEVTQGRVVLRVRYEYACGSGSGGEATFILGRHQGAFRLERFSSDSASRDGSVQRVFDYRRRRQSVLRGRPDSDRPARAAVRTLSAPAPRWPGLSFERCPPPRQRAALPEC